MNGEVRDVMRPFDGDASLALITAKDEADALDPDLVSEPARDCLEGVFGEGESVRQDVRFDGGCPCPVQRTDDR